MTDDQVMVELWGSDGRHYNNGLAGNWSLCMGTVTIEDKTEPVITAPDLAKTYNSAAKNWVNCTDKEIIGTSSNTDGRIADEALSNVLFGIPDIYGIECSGSVKYEVTKALTCDTGTITRKWTVTKGSFVTSTVLKLFMYVLTITSLSQYQLIVTATCTATVGTRPMS